MSLGDWRNDKNNNKGWAVFNWTPNLTTNSQYYLYVEIDPDNAVSEVHEGRYKSDNTTINDYGGNNTGFYPFYVYNVDDPNAPIGGNVMASAADKIRLTPLSFMDGDGKTITDMLNYILEHKDESFVTITANFNYNGSNIPYAYLGGYVLTQSGKQKIPDAGINTIVHLNDLSNDDIDEVFMLQDIALFNGSNKITFTISPAELIQDAENITAKANADLITFGIKTITEAEILSADEEFYEGEDPDFELEELPDGIVSASVTKIYTLTANKNVFWNISSVKLNGTASTSDEENNNEDDDDRNYLDITIETISDDEDVPDNYGREVFITVSSIAGYTPKGDFEITVKKSADGDEWTDTETLTFDSTNGEGDGGSEGGNNMLFSSSSGCNSGFTLFALGFVLLALILKRKAL